MKHFAQRVVYNTDFPIVLRIVAWDVEWRPCECIHEYESWKATPSIITVLRCYCLFALNFNWTRYLWTCFILLTPGGDVFLLSIWLAFSMETPYECLNVVLSKLVLRHREDCSPEKKWTRGRLFLNGIMQTMWSLWLHMWFWRNLKWQFWFKCLNTFLILVTPNKIMWVWTLHLLKL